MTPQQKYNEKHRPQFHFTAEKGWLNDPNGLVFYEGEYHLFYQHNPFGREWSDLTGSSVYPFEITAVPRAWGHAVSGDLVHWRHLPDAIEPDARGSIFSGSAVVDWDNTAGFQTGREKTLVAIYTAAGGCVRPKAPTTQCLAFSNDKGRTWTKYAGNPVMGEISPGNRDPKVFRFSGKKTEDSRWIMVLYVSAGGQPSAPVSTMQFFSSPDLKNWTYMSKVEGFYECPDFFELPVDGNPENNKWVLLDGSARYMIGAFDGGRFVPETGPHTGDWGPNYYSTQTYSDIPETDGRRIIIGWMAGGNYPGMPFNQQMSFPCELSLKTFPEGIRLCKYPVREVENLYAKTMEKTAAAVKPGENPLPDVTGELFDIEAEISVGSSLEFGFDIGGKKLSYVVSDEELFFNYHYVTSVRLPMIDGRIKLRILIDRTSVEIFGNDGRVIISACVLFDSESRKIGFYSSIGVVECLKIKMRSLKSAWRGQG